MSESRKFPGCFKYGCIGCLTLFALFIGFVLLIGAIQLANEQDVRPEKTAAEHELPAPPEPPRPPLPPEAPLPPEVPRPPAHPPTEVPVGGHDVILPGGPTPAAGRIVLDLTMGDFVIRPGPPGEPIRIDADYDSGAFELTEEFNTRDDGTWIYKVSFGGRGGFLGVLFRGGVEGGTNRIELTIPRGQPIEIVGKIGTGESQTDLGGLWVRNVDLEYSMGEHFLEIRDPLPEPMERFAIKGSMGSLEIRSLGGASPRAVEVRHSMGELLLDLEGPWRRDATVDLDFGMGDCRLWLPEDVRVDLDRARVSLGDKEIDLRPTEDLPPDAPTLTVKVSGGMGSIRIEN